MPIETMPVWAEVDLDRLAHNAREVRRITRPGTAIMAVVKADAYGHGAVTVARVFLENGAERLAVATPREALELRRAGYDVPILVLGYTPAQQSGEVVEHGVTPAVYTLEHAEALSKAAAARGRVVKVHVKLETGMGRLGFLPTEESVDDIARISKLPSLEVEGAFTHFAVSDTRDKAYTRGQFERFMWMVEALEARGVSIPLRHVSNSAAVIDLPEYNLDMVRPGSLLYGIYPSDEVDKDRIELRPAMTLKARISNVKAVPAGTGVSYGLTYTTGRPSRIGTISVGYADGYSRLLSNRAEVGVRGRRAPVIGRVCMDQCMVDLTDAGGVEIGDEAVLFGDVGGAPSVDEVAGWMGSIFAEVLTSLSRRVPRVYIRDGEVVEVVDYLGPG